MPAPTAWVTDERFYWWRASDAPSPFIQPRDSAESAESKRRFGNLVAVSRLPESGALAPLAPRIASEDEMARVHERAWLARLREVSASGGG
jgi:acetoin utilization deacetylase AcuC-like enzyme